MCCGSGHRCGVCKVVGLVLGVLSVVALIAALLGLYNAHMTDGAWTFGTTEGSLSLMALFLGVFVVNKCMKMCPCNKKGMAGVCPGCGHSPCTCGK